MISVKALYDSVQRMAAKDQKGYNMPDDFNGDLDNVQLEVAEYIYQFFEINSKAVDILGPFIPRIEPSSNSTGAVAKPSDYLHLIALDFKVSSTVYYPIEYYGVNGAMISQQIPQRAADASKNRYRYSYENTAIQIYPKALCTVRMSYLKRPPTASIAFTENTSGTEDFLVYDAGASVDLEWSETCFNLFLALMLEKLGVQIKDQVLLEYSQLGFARETIMK